MYTGIWRYFYTPYELLHPYYECEDCIGMREHGCYCAAMGCWAPNIDPPRWARVGRRMYKWWMGGYQVLWEWRRDRPMRAEWVDEFKSPHIMIVHRFMKEGDQ